MSHTARVAVIGAGAAGLAATKNLLDVGADVVTYEKGEHAGGLWVRGNSNGLSPAYDSLHLNTSRGRTEFADFPMPADWIDYPSADHVAGYLVDYARTFGVTERIRFGTPVASVERDDHGRWQVTTEAGDTDDFDAVVVANGHNWDPKWPSPAYPGTFDGTQIHAHDYRSADIFTGRRVVVVGMGNSAMDIAVDASYVAAAPVLLSARHGVHILPKYLFGRPADATGGAIAALPWRLRQRIAETSLRLAVGRPEKYGLPAPSGGFFQNHPTISDTILHRLTHGAVAARPGIERLDGDHVIFSDGRREPARHRVRRTPAVRVLDGARRSRGRRDQRRLAGRRLHRRVDRDRGRRHRHRAVRLLRGPRDRWVRRSGRWGVGGPVEWSPACGAHRLHARAGRAHDRRGGVPAALPPRRHRADHELRPTTGMRARRPSPSSSNACRPAPLLSAPGSVGGVEAGALIRAQLESGRVE